MTIAIGSLVIAPRGAGQLDAGRAYHFLRRCHTRARVLLVHLSETNQARASLVVMSAHDFETALQRTEPNRLLIQPATASLPPWLRMTEASSVLSSVQGLHVGPIGKRLAQIEPALACAEDILEAFDPIRELNQFAHASVVKQNETRYRTWFLSYLLFGRPGLETSHRRCGRWQRTEANGQLKRGRPSLSAGPGAGHNVTPDMAKKIHDGFVQHVVLGDTWSTIYQRCLREVFGVHAPLNKRGRAVLHHPAGEPFPSSNQFRDWTVKQLGLDSTQVAMLGESRAKYRLQAAKGSYSRQLSTLLERVEADAFYVDDHPTSQITGETMEKLCVVRQIDVLTGMLVGIGFSFGRETHAAYQMASLCAAMDKVQFCALFGVRIQPGQWPSIGLPHQYITDRGPGAKRVLSDMPPIRSVARSYCPQAKAYVEASNPKSKQIDGKPRYMQSPLSPIQMIRREIHSLLAHNASADIYARTTTEARCNVEAFTPNALWAFYNDRARTSAHVIAFERAIKTYGQASNATLTEKGVVMPGRCYSAEPLWSEKVLDRVVRSGPVKINVYQVPFALNFIWAEIAGTLYQLRYVEPSVSGMSVAELSEVEFAEGRKQDNVRRSQHRTDRHATAVHHGDAFEGETGQAWDSKRAVSGRRKIGKAAKAEANAVNDLYGRKSA